jgi:twitching motility protein PilI
MKGIANVRGVLLPIADLSSVLGGSSLAIDSRSRVLSVNYAEARVGLLVDEVFGVKHFRKEEQLFHAQTTRAHGLRPYLHDMFAQGGMQWSIFSMTELVAKDIFKRFIL